MRPAPPLPRWGSHPARPVACCPHRPGAPAVQPMCTAFLPCLPSRPLSHLPPLYPCLGYPWAALPSQLPHTSRPTLPASPYRTIYLAHMLSARGRSVHRHVYPCAEVSMAHPSFAARTQSPRVLKRTNAGRGCRKSSPCDVPLLCLPVGAVPAKQLLDLLDVGEEVRDQISPHLGGHRCVVRPLVHLGW